MAELKLRPIPIPANRLFTDSIDSFLTDGQGRYLVEPVLRPWFMVGRNIEKGSAVAALVDANGRLLVNGGTTGLQSQGGEVQIQPGDNTDALLTVGDANLAGTLWWVRHIMPSALVDATVSSRTWVPCRYTPARILVSPTRVLDLAALTLTASEDGQAAVVPGVQTPNHVTWDAGTQALVTNGGSGLIPPRLVPNDALGCPITVNKQTGDRTALSIEAVRLT